MTLTNNVQATLLLTARLTGMSGTDARPLTTGEWNKLLVWLRDRGMKPGDLLVDDPLEILREWDDPRCPADRMLRLLNRGVALSLALEKWQRAGIWVAARSEPDYPGRLKERLKALSAPILFGCGNSKLLEAGGIAVVGSRNARAEDEKFALSLGDKVARSGKSVVSGGARGIDQAAMLGAIGAGGTVIGVLADSLLKMSVSQMYRQALHRRDLALVSPFQPEAEFTVGNAMARNKYIYCLSDCAVAVHSGTSGGTWNGAVENLKNRWVPLWVKRTADRQAGNGELVRQGAAWLPERLLDDDPQALRDWLSVGGKDLPERRTQVGLFEE
jgi:predicted Rossmann fold nucleotide-binding protein DprA/Smf involved in DNA uptake